MLDILTGEAVFKPLLHTWSLSVELQFYLVCPILFTLFCRSFHKSLFVITFLSVSLWLLLSVDTNFFLLPSRLFEFVIGFLFWRNGRTFVDILSRITIPYPAEILCYLGRISFSLYLIHWPVICFYRYENFGRTGFTHLEIAEITALTIGLGILQFHVIERAEFLKNGRRLFPVYFRVLAATFSTNGLPTRENLRLPHWRSTNQENDRRQKLIGYEPVI